MEHLVAACNVTIVISRGPRLALDGHRDLAARTGRQLVNSAESERRIRARKRVERGGEGGGGGRGGWVAAAARRNRAGRYSGTGEK